MIETAALDKLVKLIISRVHPSKVILFGSRAKGIARNDSDFDLMVIKSGVSNEREISSSIYRAMFTEKINLPVDVIAIDEGKWKSLKNNSQLIYNVVEKEGIVLYG